eukprot:7487937-Pyramimonas_sp.AAC.1
MNSDTGRVDTRPVCATPERRAPAPRNVTNNIDMGTNHRGEESIFLIWEPITNQCTRFRLLQRVARHRAR